MMKLAVVSIMTIFCVQGFAQQKKTTTGGGVVDENGTVYVKQHYKGVIPGIRDVPDVPSKKHPKKVDHPVVEWIGFQPYKDYSRVFVQMLGQFTFVVNKTTDKEIDITIPGATLDTRNDARELVTFRFDTQVNLVKTTLVKTDAGKSVVIKILLKKNVGYLFRQSGKYIFVDVENPH